MSLPLHVYVFARLLNDVFAKRFKESQMCGLVSTVAGLSSLGVPGMPWHPQFLADQLTLSQPRGGGADYAHHITKRIPRFSDLPTALHRYTSFDVEDLGFMKIHPHSFYLLHWPIFFCPSVSSFYGMSKSYRHVLVVQCYVSPRKKYKREFAKEKREKKE